MIIYTDGSRRKNNKGAYGFIVVEKKDVKMCFVNTANNTTSNRMELMALYSALRYIKKMKKDNSEVYSDSQYVVNGYNHWIEKWVRNDWKAYKGNSVLNQDIWEKLFEIKEQLHVLGINVLVEWVRGHDTNNFNNYIDNLVQNLTK